VRASDEKSGRIASGDDSTEVADHPNQIQVCSETPRTSRIVANRIGDTEVNGPMTANWPGSVVYVLLLAFFALAAIGIGLGVYAASVLKKAEVGTEEKASLET
jgi:hypothetical protein